MDRISDLPDALLLKILSILSTKDVVTTMVLSKRWQFLWMLVPRLEYSYDMYQNGQDWRFLRFVYSSLLLHEAPVLESFSLKIGPKSDAAVDLGVCVKPALTRSVRELNIEIESYSAILLPRSLYTGCRMLVKLTLDNAVFVDVSSSSSVSFPSLKTLSLTSMKYPSGEFICKLLSNCPVLEDLFVDQGRDDNVVNLVVRVASLKVLTVSNLAEEDYRKGLVIDAPSLEFLDIVDYAYGFCKVESSMPKIEEAHLDVTYANTQQLLGSLTSVVQLSLCLTATPMDTYMDGTIFSRLEKLKLCTCDTKWLYLLMRLLKDSPKLRFLVIEKLHNANAEDPCPCWSEPNQVPECLLSSLEIFEWLEYEGREEEKEVATFVLRNSGHLKMASFYTSSTDPVENLKMLRALSMSPRSSSICQLEFHGNFSHVSE